MVTQSGTSIIKTDFQTKFLTRCLCSTKLCHHLQLSSHSKNHNINSCHSGTETCIKLIQERNLIGHRDPKHKVQNYQLHFHFLQMYKFCGIYLTKVEMGFFPPLQVIHSITPSFNPAGQQNEFILVAHSQAICIPRKTTTNTQLYLYHYNQQGFTN